MSCEPGLEVWGLRDEEESVTPLRIVATLISVTIASAWVKHEEDQKPHLVIYALAKVWVYVCLCTLSPRHLHGCAYCIIHHQRPLLSVRVQVSGFWRHHQLRSISADWPENLAHLLPTVCTSRKRYVAACICWCRRAFTCSL